VQQNAKTIAIAAAPALLALLAVLSEPYLTEWAKGREATLPLIMFGILASLLHPRLRTQLVITLCYGVAFLAIRDAFRLDKLHLPLQMNAELKETGIIIALLLIAALSIIAAIGETVNPGTVWTRRCYFSAAALYFTGLGINSFGLKGSWQAVMLCVIGLTSLIGCLFAHRIVAVEQEEAREQKISDEAIQKLTEQQHQRTLRDKEWHETPAKGEAESSSVHPNNAV
jgi:hypothetical protein